MGMHAPVSFQEHFATLTDPRCPQAPNSRHLLLDILILAVCAVIGGAEGARAERRPRPGSLGPFVRGTSDARSATVVAGSHPGVRPMRERVT